ncbi:MAG: hypothetical protein GWP15_01390 [Nitrospirae bacterium]|nr:hypothetical protein [Nitrospirota bacterium]
MSFDAEQVEIESGYEDLLQVVDLVDELMSFGHWQEASLFLDGLIPENMLYMCYEDSPEKVARLLDSMSNVIRERLYLSLLDRMDGLSLSDRRFEEIINKRHVARLCLVEEEAAQIKFLGVIARKIRDHAIKVVGDDPIGALFSEGRRSKWHNYLTK